MKQSSLYILVIFIISNVFCASVSELRLSSTNIYVTMKTTNITSNVIFGFNINTGQLVSKSEFNNFIPSYSGSLVTRGDELGVLYIFGTYSDGRNISFPQMIRYNVVDQSMKLYTLNTKCDLFGMMWNSDTKEIWGIKILQDSHGTYSFQNYTIVSLSNDFQNSTDIGTFTGVDYRSTPPTNGWSCRSKVLGLWTAIDVEQTLLFFQDLGDTKIVSYTSNPLFVITKEIPPMDIKLYVGARYGQGDLAIGLFSDFSVGIVYYVQQDLFSGNMKQLYDFTEFFEQGIYYLFDSGAWIQDTMTNTWRFVVLGSRFIEKNRYSYELFIFGPHEQSGEITLLLNIYVGESWSDMADIFPVQLPTM